MASESSVARQAARASRTGIEHRVYRSFEEIRTMQAEWDAFVERVDGDIFSTFDWCRIWWKYYGRGRRLEIHVTRRDGEIIAIWPLFRETLRLGPFALKAIRLVACDHELTTCRPAVAPDCMQDGVETLMAALGSNGSAAWDVFNLGPLPGYADDAYALLDAVQRWAARRGNYEAYLDEDVGPHIVFAVPGTVDEWLHSLSARERKNILQDERWLSRRYRLRQESVTEPSEILNAFDSFVEMHQANWRAKGRLGHFEDWPHSRAFHRELAGALGSLGRVRFSQVNADDDVVSIQYSYAFGRRLHWVLTAREDGDRWNRVSLGRVGFVGVMRTASNLGLSEIDGMRGYYEYKVRLGGVVKKVKALTVVCEGGGRRRWRWFQWMACLVDVAYMKVWFRRLAPRLGLLRGPLWEVWIKTRL